jgi:glycosyltransferase involved in cell wall biosynthesis
MKYDVTIGIPVYKSIDCIKQSIESALSQSYSSIEFLIIDDAGQDGSIDIIRDFQASHFRGKDIHVITHYENIGVSASRNEIIEQAQGIYLYFMDSDDIIATNTISLLMQNIRQYDAEIAFGSYEKIETSGNRTVYQYPSLQLLEKDALASFAYRKYAGIQASACNYLVKTSLLRDNKVCFIDTDYWEDLVFTFDLVTYISRAVLLPDITYTYLCRDGSLSHYQQRMSISKNEIMRNVIAINHLKHTSSILYNKVYFPNRCFNIVMTDFYMVCAILKRRKNIKPYITNKEIKALMSHPATWGQIRRFKQSRISNILLYVLGKIPSFMCVTAIWCLGKMKKLI